MGPDDRDNSSRLTRDTVDNFGLSNHAIRIWLDVQQLTNLGLTATDVRDGGKPGFARYQTVSTITGPRSVRSTLPMA